MGHTIKLIEINLTNQVTPEKSSCHIPTSEESHYEVVVYWILHGWGYAAHEYLPQLLHINRLNISWHRISTFEELCFMLQYFLTGGFFWWNVIRFYGELPPLGEQISISMLVAQQVFLMIYFRNHSYMNKIMEKLLVHCLEASQEVVKSSFLWILKTLTSRFTITSF